MEVKRDFAEMVKRYFEEAFDETLQVGAESWKPVLCSVPWASITLTVIWAGKSRLFSEFGCKTY